MQPIRQRVRTGPGSSFNLFCLQGKAGGRFYHRHPDDELCFIVHGQSLVELGQHRFKAQAPSIMWAGPELPHAYQCLPDSEVWILQLPPLLWQALGPDLPEMAELQQLRRRARKGQIWTHGTATAWRQRLIELQQRQGLLRLTGLLDLLHSIAQLPQQRRKPALAANNNPRLDHLLRWMQQQLAGSPGLDAAAAQLGLSRSQLNRWLRQQTSHSFVELLQRMRVEQACRLLIEAQQSITDIALGVGFGNQSGFNRVFKKLTGITPRQYRDGNYRDRDRDPDREW